MPRCKDLENRGTGEQSNRGTEGQGQGHSESESQKSPKEEAPPLASLKKGLKSATKAVGHVELLVHVLEDRDLLRQLGVQPCR